ncbi:MAG: hypothetical protein NVS3B7_11690 [Candidatus Elarobacter sp.]
MTHRPFLRLLALLAASSVVAACGGGGGTGSGAPQPPVPVPTPVPTATPPITPSCRALAPVSVGSTYTLTSNPSGIAVQRVDPTTSGCALPLGVTQTTDTPASAPHPWQSVFAPAGISPYTVTVAQQLNGAHAVFYNQAGDSSGTLTVSSLQSLRRGTLGVAPRGDVLQRARPTFRGAGVDPARVLVRYRGTPAQMRGSARGTESMLRAEGFDVPSTDGALQRVLTVPAGTDVATFVQSLRARSDVAEVYPTHKRFALGRAAVVVNDEHMKTNVDQWYLSADGFPYAWAYSTGLYGGGKAVKIAVIDTGIDLKNTDLNGKIDKSMGLVAGTTAQDTNGHGTNTAAIAAAATNNLVGFAGAGYDAHLLIYNIFPDATATSDKQTANTGDEARAIQDAVTSGADVISLSLGAAQDFPDSPTGNGFDKTEHDAIVAAINAGVTVVAAAGNDADGSETGTRHVLLDYPAAYDGVLAVGASALRDNNTGKLEGSTEYVTPYSQYGPGLGVVAPGGDPVAGDKNVLHWIWNYSTSTAVYPLDKCTSPSPATSCTALFAGTSQATPQVAAAAALLIASAGGHNSLTPAQVVQLIDSTADNINDAHQGHGRLNAYKALAALNRDTAAYSGPSPASTSPTQAVAFAYDNPGGTVPRILDVNYPKGVPLDANGGFRIGDVPAGAAPYRVAVWYDANGNGVVDAGDQFGTAAVTCNPQQKCAIGSITLTTVAAGFTLP